jgi:predicted RNase H-like HicB family nuclease
MDEAPKYERVVYWSEEDNAWIAEVPELPYTATDGPTPQAALDAVEETVQEWLETAKEEGWDIPVPKKRIAQV